VDRQGRSSSPEDIRANLEQLSQEPLRESVVIEAKPAVRIMGSKGRSPSGDGVLGFLGFVLTFVAMDVAALRFGCDSHTWTRELLHAGDIEPTVPHPGPDHPPLSFDSA
jgi:hypothetical protein